MTAGPEPGIRDGHALGCGTRVVAADGRFVDSAQEAVFGILADIDVACSRFRSDSEITAVNAAGGREVVLSPLLGRAVAAALRAARLSRGAVDPTVGTAVRVAGYDRDFDVLPARGEEALRLVARPVPGWQAVSYDERSRTVRAPEGVELDLGATAKALAADLAAEAALAAAPRSGGVLVSLGGDIAVRGEAPAGGWSIQVGEDSAEAIREGAEAVLIREGGLATSSTTVRRWERGGAVLHHIIDPRTGLPAAGPWRSATVAAGSCVDANTASTAAVVLGPEALPWLAEGGLPARLVDLEGRVVRVGGWPQGVPRAPCRAVLSSRS